MGYLSERVDNTGGIISGLVCDIINYFIRALDTFRSKNPLLPTFDAANSVFGKGFYDNLYSNIIMPLAYSVIIVILLWGLVRSAMAKDVKGDVDDPILLIIKSAGAWFGATFFGQLIQLIIPGINKVFLIGFKAITGQTTEYDIKEFASGVDIAVAKSDKEGLKKMIDSIVAQVTSRGVILQDGYKDLLDSSNPNYAFLDQDERADLQRLVKAYEDKTTDTDLGMGDGNGVMDLIIKLYLYITILKMVVRLIYVLTERYIYFTLLYICAPLGIATYGSNSTREISKRYMSSLASAVLSLGFTNILISMYLSAQTAITQAAAEPGHTGDFNIFMTLALAIGIGKFTLELDDWFNKLGLINQGASAYDINGQSPLGIFSSAARIGFDAVSKGAKLAGAIATGGVAGAVGATGVGKMLHTIKDVASNVDNSTGGKGSRESLDAALKNVGQGFENTGSAQKKLSGAVNASNNTPTLLFGKNGSILGRMENRAQDSDIVNRTGASPIKSAGKDIKLDRNASMDMLEPMSDKSLFQVTNDDGEVLGTASIDDYGAVDFTPKGTDTAEHFDSQDAFNDALNSPNLQEYGPDGTFYTATDSDGDIIRVDYDAESGLMTATHSDGSSTSYDSMEGLRAGEGISSLSPCEIDKSALSNDLQPGSFAMISATEMVIARNGEQFTARINPDGSLNYRAKISQEGQEKLSRLEWSDGSWKTVRSVKGIDNKGQVE